MLSYIKSFLLSLIILVATAVSAIHIHVDNHHEDCVKCEAKKNLSSDDIVIVSFDSVEIIYEYIEQKKSFYSHIVSIYKNSRAPPFLL